MKKLRCNTEQVLFHAIIVLMAVVIYDTIGKFVLSQIGFFRFLSKTFNPHATFYKLTYGVWSVLIVPVTIVLFLLCIRDNKKRPWHQNKFLIAMALLCVILVAQLAILIIALYNNQMFS